MEPYEIISGPLTLWLAPVGTAFPAIGAAPAAAWKMVGTSGTRNYSNDGVTVALTQSVNKVRPAGAVGPVKALRTDEDLSVTVTIWDGSLEQYTFALSGEDPVTTAAGVGTPGFRTLGLSRGENVTAYALLARGASPEGDDFIAQYEVPRCYQSGNSSAAYNKGVPVGLALAFDALEDLSAANENERFGRLRVQHQAALP